MAIILDGTNGISSPDFEMSGVGVTYPLVSGTVATASGTAIDFTAIPSWVKRITVMFNGVSTSGTSLIQIRLGSTTFVTTGYNCVGITSINSSIGTTGATSGFVLGNSNQVATYTYSGTLTFINISSNDYVAHGGVGFTTANVYHSTVGSVALTGILDRIRITTVNGTDTFDAGTINIAYE